MKNLFFILLFAPMLALASPPDFSAITKALNGGDVSTLAEYLDKDVEVTILDDDGVYSKAQAVQVIKEFFAKHPPRSFKLMHQGTNNKSLHYSIGNLITNGAQFRVCLYMKEENGKFLIKELSIEEE